MKALKAGCLSLAVLLASCAHGPIPTKEIPLSEAHIDPADQRPEALAESIPALTPFELPAPDLTEVDLYSVVVTEALLTMCFSLWLVMPNAILIYTLP